MADLIDRQAAIDDIWTVSPLAHLDREWIDRWLRQLLPANNSEFPNSSDTISRQAAIDLLKQMRKDGDMIPWEGKDVFARIRNLPSVQPEIIRCKDCKWYGRADKRRFYRGTDCLNHRIDTIVPDKDYCSRAERRTDGRD